jgi:hypothetical protein
VQARRSLSALVATAVVLLFFSLGFDLDRGELKCEQAAAHLAECCPEVVFRRDSCIQEGGCSREHDATLVASAESDCLRAESCDELVARGVCERIEERQNDWERVDGPSIQVLYEEDWLCD